MTAHWWLTKHRDTISIVTALCNTRIWNIVQKEKSTYQTTFYSHLIVWSTQAHSHSQNALQKINKLLITTDNNLRRPVQDWGHDLAVSIDINPWMYICNNIFSHDTKFQLVQYLTQYKRHKMGLTNKILVHRVHWTPPVTTFMPPIQTFWTNATNYPWAFQSPHLCVTELPLKYEQSLQLTFTITKKIILSCKDRNNLSAFPVAPSIIWVYFNAKTNSIKNNQVDSFHRCLGPIHQYHLSIDVTQPTHIHTHTDTSPPR